MGINVSYPLKTETKKDFQMPLPKSLTEVAEYATSYLPAEWHPQSGIQLTWPHAGTDWAYMLDEVEACFVNIARAIAARQLLLIVSPEPERVKLRLEKEGIGTTNIRFFTCETNDTWARDHGAITIMHNGRPFLLDFCFNGWGLKFASNHDNRITAQAVAKKVLHGEYVNSLDIVLEGGSIESDGQGTILTTSECLLSPNRNGRLSREEVGETLKQRLSAHRILWLDHGYLAGDDTDSHIDTLARFCDEHTIAYVACEDEADEHYEALKLMESQLKTFCTTKGQPYRLLKLPMADAIVVDGERLPATYANFLILNEAILCPTYGQSANDAKALEVLTEAFPGREIIGIDCRALIKQHGSLHCVTMQYPQGVIR